MLIGLCLNILKCMLRFIGEKTIDLDYPILGKEVVLLACLAITFNISSRNLGR